MHSKNIFTKVALSLSLLCAVAVISGSALADTRVMLGTHKVILDIVAADWENHPVENIPNYSNRTFRQQVLQKDEYSTRVLIEVKMEPLGSSAGFPIRGLAGNMRQFIRPEKMIQSDDPSIVNTARQLTSGASTVAEAANNISNWVHDHLTYTIPVQQDALSVYRSGRGSCQGYTRLTIALCRAAGIPARYAHGYLVPGEDWGARVERFGVKTHGGGYHAWLEIYYPDVGWAFTDGEYTKNYVDPYHIIRWIDGESSTPIPRNPIENLNADTGNTYSKVEDANLSKWVDSYAGPKEDILGLPIRSQQTGAVWGQLTNSKGHALMNAKLIVWGQPDASGRIKGRVLSLPDSGIWSIAGLQTGRHKISIKVGEKRKDFHIEAKRGQVVRKDLVFPY